MPLPATSFVVRSHANEADKHASNVNTLICHNNKLYSGAEDGKIKMWGEDLKLIKTIDAHGRGITAFAVGNETLYSSSNDGTVKAWALGDLKGKGTLLTEQIAITKVCYSDNTLYAGNIDGKVKLFKNDKPTATFNLAESLTDMIVCGKLLFIIRNLDRVLTIVIFQMFPDSNKILKTLMAQGPMCIAGEKFCCINGKGKHILVHENSVGLQFEESVQARDAHQMDIKSLCGMKTGENTTLFSGGMDKTIKQWIIAGNTIEKVNTCNVNIGVNAIAIGTTGMLFVGGTDGHIVRVDL